MKKVTRILGLCALVALATVSCKKDNNNVLQGGKSFHATINQPTGNAKTHIGEDGITLWWNAGDQITVFAGESVYGNFSTNDANKAIAEFNGEIVESENYSAFYPTVGEPVEGKVTINLSDNQTFVNGNFATDMYPMSAVNDGDDFLFRSPCAVVCLPLTGNANITSIVLSGKNGEKLAGDLQFNVADATYAGMENGAEEVTLEHNTTLSDVATNFCFVVAAPSPIFEGGLKFVVNHDGKSDVLETTKDNSLTAETILTMSPVEINKPAPEIGYFSVGVGVGESPRKVTFAPGNLWYDNGTWRMENNQWEYHNETANAQGLFCWSNESSNYGITFAEGRTFVDWGGLTICKPNSDETYAPNEWRTLTNLEYATLLEYRENYDYYTESCDKKLHRPMEVHGVNCMVIAPDNYEGDIDNATWDELEAAGAFAMPMAGGYEPFAQHHFAEGTEFAWWSATPSDSGYSAFHVYYYWNGKVEYWNQGSMYHMFSVRLAKTVVE